jgi:hypothetical protein
MPRARPRAQISHGHQIALASRQLPDTPVPLQDSPRAWPSPARPARDPDPEPILTVILRRQAVEQNPVTRKDAMSALSLTNANQDALERLAAALDPSDHAITLVTGQGQVPYLAITSRHADLAEDVYADQQSFWWSWAEPICAVDDPLTAARKITRVLQAAPQPTHG